MSADLKPSVRCYSRGSQGALASLLWGMALSTGLGLCEVYAQVTPEAFVSKAAAAPADPQKENQHRALALKQVREVLGTAWKLSPQVREAQAALNAAVQDVDEAKGARYPQVDVAASSSQKSLESGHQSGLAQATTTLSVTTPVIDWGRNARLIDARESAVKSASYRLAAAQDSVAAEVLSMILEANRYRQQSYAAETYIERIQKLVDMLAQIVIEDKGRASEWTQARTRLLQAKASREVVSAKIRDVEVQLHRLLGDVRPASDDVPMAFVQVLPLSQALSTVQQQNALMQAAADAEATKAQAEALGAAQFPQLNWVISKSTAKDLFGQTSPWQTGLTINYGAFKGFSAVAAERAAIQRAQAGIERWSQQKLDAETRLRAAHESAQNQFQRCKDYGALMSDTDAVRQLYFDQWYHLGRRTLLDVLTAENEHYSTHSAFIQAFYDGVVASVKVSMEAGLLTRMGLPSLEDAEPK